MTKNKKSNKLLLYLSIGVGALILFFIIAKQAGWVAKKEPVKVTLSKVEKKTIVETVSANGKVQPEKEVKISSDVSGEIIDLYVKEGDSVSKGQILVKINPDIYVTALERANASLNNARANLASSRARLIQAEARFGEIKSTYERNQKLYQQKVVSDADIEGSKAAFLNAQAELEAARQGIKAAEFTVNSFEASLSEAQKSLNRTTVYAPVSGIISRLNVERGERVVGTSQMAGTEMMRISNLSDMEARVEVNENDIVRVNVGDTCLVEVDAYLNRKFKGVVTEVANSANLQGVSADQVTNFTVKIRLLKESYADLLQKSRAPFRPGMSASVEIQTDVAYQVPAIPVEAVTTRDTRGNARKEISEEKPEDEEEAGSLKVEEKGKPQEQEPEMKEVVFVYKNGKAQMKEVKYGIQDDKFIHILSGLEASDEIISGPYSVISKKLKDGDEVLKVSQKELFESTMQSSKNKE